MSNNKMLIDATHPEETRVVVLKNGRVEEFDYESAARKVLRGNIYLAKVTRVEPSLQAAFVDYGGNRHGFLAFNEIHPDYYQIPVADRQALIDEEAAAEAAEEREADARVESRARRQASSRGRSSGEAEDRGYPSLPDAENNAIDVTDLMPPERLDGEDTVTEINESTPPPEVIEPAREVAADAHPDDVLSSDPVETAGDAQDDTSPLDDAPRPIGNVENQGVEEIEASDLGRSDDDASGEAAASEDALEELPSRPRRRMRSYKIQEVIRRRQIILIQVVKEERGTKGAALTTYLSLAGRYTVLMPNTARGGGISRKITNAQDRKRLKAIADELEVPEGMGLIIRTAGAARTKQEIKRDFEYLLRLWESVRDMTLQSVAPSLVYEEGDLIKRSIRDLYTKDVDEIVVAGDAAFKDARDFMQMLMPSHTKNVVEFHEPEPLFTRFQIERQLNAMFSPYVHLKSGGYLVINQTEALVAIDVNSGKSTREYSIEETALNTNAEAADEIARQLKLRDLAGLIVIDFIDMEEKRNNRYVERKLKDALRFDRARIQVGHISHFGLMEMSRQRLRTGVLEGSTTQCPHCQGTGIIRSVESVALAVLRGLEDALLAGQSGAVIATTTAEVALYILNHKRVFIIDMERRNGAPITIQASDKVQGANFTVERVALRVAGPVRRGDRAAVNMDWGFDGESETEVVAAADEPVDISTESEAEDRDGDRTTEQGEDRAGGREANGRRPRRRRRGRRGEGDGDQRSTQVAATQDTRVADDERPAAGDGQLDQIDDEDVAEVAAGGDEAATATGPRGELDADGENGDGRRGKRGRRRGRRGGRRGRERDGSVGDGEQPETAVEGNGELQDALAPSSPTGDFAIVPANDPGAAESAGHVMPAYAYDAPVQVADLDPAASSPVQTASLPDMQREPVVEATRIEIRAVEEQPVAPEPIRLAQAFVAPEPPREPEPEVNPRAARTMPITTEPVLARVVVGGDGTVAHEEPKPARRGWWSRKV